MLPGPVEILLRTNGWEFAGGASVQAVFVEGGARRLEYIIAYDLTDDRRRERLARTLLDYGERIQHSVFAVHLDDELFSADAGA